MKYHARAMEDDSKTGGVWLAGHTGSWTIVSEPLKEHQSWHFLQILVSTIDTHDILNHYFSLTFSCEGSLTLLFSQSVAACVNIT